MRMQFVHRLYYAVMQGGAVLRIVSEITLTVAADGPPAVSIYKLAHLIGSIWTTSLILEWQWFIFNNVFFLLENSNY